MNIFVFTASNSEAQKHLQDSITNNVSKDLVKNHLSPEEFQELRRKNQGEELYCWGAVPGTSNLRNWDKLEEGDYVLTYYDKKIHFYSNVVYKIRNKELANKLWGSLGDGKTWEYMYFLTKPIRLENPIETKNVPDHLQSIFQGFAKIKDSKVEKILAEYGSVENFLNDPTEKKPPVKNIQAMMPVAIDQSLKQILCAIQTKPFILLAGISGTGKSRLVRTLAYKTCWKKDLQKDIPANYELIPVRPNWHDSSELLGYVSRISGKPKYVATKLVRFLVKAWKNEDVPFFLCLDEMNLAPVEQYFAEFLSIIETRKVNNGVVTSDPVLSKEDFTEENVFKNLLIDIGVDKDSKIWQTFLDKGITLPPNLVIMGTVNMDETTHSFSRKVLDRAMTFEMNQVDLSAGLDATDDDWSYPNECIRKEDVIGSYTSGSDVYQEFKENGNKIITYLNGINNILKNTPFKIAYRVRDEFLIYAYHKSQNSNSNSWLNESLDEMTVMKILSRIEGDENRTGQVLSDLQNLFKDDYPNSYNKVTEMIERLQNGYTSFWS